MKGPMVTNGASSPVLGSWYGVAWLWGTTICGKRSGRKCTSLGMRRHPWHLSITYSHRGQSHMSNWWTNKPSAVKETGWFCWLLKVIWVGSSLWRKKEGKSCAEQKVCGKGHVSAIVTHHCADRPMHGIGGLPLYLHQGMSILDELDVGADMPHWSHASSNNKPDACVFQCCTLCIGI